MKNRDVDDDDRGILFLVLICTIDYYLMMVNQL